MHLAHKQYKSYQIIHHNSNSLLSLPPCNSSYHSFERTISNPYQLPFSNFGTSPNDTMVLSASAAQMIWGFPSDSLELSMVFSRFYAQHGCGDNKTEKGEIYIIVNKRFKLFFSTIGEEDVR